MRRTVAVLFFVILELGGRITAKPGDPRNSHTYSPNIPNITSSQIDATTSIHSETGDTANSKSSTTIKVPTDKKPKPLVSGTASASLRRIKKEYKDVVEMGICYDWVKGRLITSSTTTRDSGDVHLIVIGPLATNLRHWHFSFRGVKNSLYESGIYHGRILLPKDYPTSPPRVQLLTPSGRFKPFADICLSASAFHPESWTPQWTVLSLVHGLRLHMLTNPQEIGGVVSSADDTLEHARRSLSWKCAWIVGNTKIIVDHRSLLEQGALTIEMDDEEESDGAVSLKKLSLDSTRPLTSPEPVREVVDTDPSIAPLSGLDEDTSVLRTPTTQTSDDTSSVEGGTTKKKEETKKKKSRRSHSQSETSTTITRTPPTIERSIRAGSIASALSKVLSSTFARRLLFLVVVWILSRR